VSSHRQVAGSRVSRTGFGCVGTDGQRRLEEVAGEEEAQLGLRDLDGQR
jgi:hypothetical protein